MVAFFVPVKQRLKSYRVKYFHPCGGVSDYNIYN